MGWHSCSLACQLAAEISVGAADQDDARTKVCAILPHPAAGTQAISMLLAGYETAASLLAYIVYHLALNPAKAAKLQRELGGVRDMSFSNLDALPYLDAVLKVDLVT